jgi:hypothetical protein
MAAQNDYKDEKIRYVKFVGVLQSCLSRAQHEMERIHRAHDRAN